MNDLFGRPLAAHEMAKPTGPGKRKTPKKGYGGHPGDGPAGETCRTCLHLCRIERAKTYLKCGLARHRWTGGPGSDVLAGSPACENWQSAKATVAGTEPGGAQP